MAAKLALERIPGFSPISRNFEALQNFVNQLANGGVNTETVGPITGTGGNISGGLGKYMAFTGLSFTYTTRNTQERARIDAAIRASTTTAAWNNVFIALNVSPAPTSKLHTNAAVGSSAASQEILDVRYLNSGGPGIALPAGFDTMLLAPNTTYTFQVLGNGSGAAGASKWDSTTSESYMIGHFWPEPV